MRPYRGILTLAVCLFVTATAGAVDRKSYRIYGMGQHLAGIVEDRYTDLLANPARVTVTPSFMNVRVGYNGDPLSLGYVADNGWAAIGEWQGRRSYNSTNSNSVTFENEFPRLISTYQYQTVDNYDNPTAKLIKSVRLFGRELGIGFEYAATLNTDKYLRNQYTYVYDATGKTVRIVRQSNITDTVVNNQSFNIELGKHDRNDSGETDLVFGITPSFTDQSNRNFASNFTDNDPDLDGLDMNGLATATPYFYLAESDAVSQSDPHINMLASVEYRTRRRDNMTDSHTAIFGTRYWRNESRLRGTSWNNNNTTVGGSITIASGTFISDDSTVSENGEAYATLGRSIRLLPAKNLLFAYAVGLQLGVSRTVHTIYSSAYRTSDSDAYAINGRLYSSIGTEYSPIRRVAIRIGVTPEVVASQLKDKQTYYNNVLNRTDRLDTYDQYATFSTGLGFSPSDNLQIDVFTNSDLTWVSTFYMQLQYLF